MIMTDRQDAEIRRVIRDAMAVDPLVTQRRIIEIVEKKLGRTLSFEYLQKLIKKVDASLAERADPKKAEKRLREMRETFRLARENLIQTAYGNVPAGMQRPSHGQRINAWRTIGVLEKILLDAELDLGVYERHVGTLGVEHRLKPLEESQRSSIISAFRVWDARVEPRRVAIAEAKPAEPTIPQPNEPKQPTGANNAPGRPKPEPIPVAGPETAVS